MADYKKNYTSGFINPFDSSKEFAFDRITANTFDSVEGSLLSSKFRKKFKCVLLSGKATGIFKAPNTHFLPNISCIVVIVSIKKFIGVNLPHEFPYFAISPLLICKQTFISDNK